MSVRRAVIFNNYCLVRKIEEEDLMSLATQVFLNPESKEHRTNN